MHDERLRELVDRIQALERDLQAERTARGELEARVARQADHITELTRAVRSITSSRIWQTLSSAGLRLLTVQSKLQRTLLKPSAKRPADGPLLSILMPVYNTPERWLRACIDSVMDQSYRNWELCIADDASPDPHVRRVLDEYRVRDQRIRVTFRTDNGGISNASNSALESVRGEFVALLDHDDELEPDALAEVAAALLQRPDADMIYTDEDKIDESGFRFDAFHKPDWSPEFFLGCMYTCHLGVYRTRLLRELNGFRPEMDGSQDYDLVLRLTARTQRVHHIAKVLYHWRTIESSTAAGGGAKEYAYAAARRALSDYVRATGRGGEVTNGPVYGTYRVRFDLPAEPEVETIYFDDRTPAADLNARAAASSATHLLFLRDSVTPLSLNALHEYCGLPGVGAAGPKMLDASGRIVSAGVVFADGRALEAYAGQPRDYPGYFLTAQLPRNCLALSGACLMTPAAVFRDSGGFDAALPVRSAALAYCIALHARGLRSVYVPYAEAMDSRPWSGEADGSWPRQDPYYNPNLPNEFAYLPPPA